MEKDKLELYLCKEIRCAIEDGFVGYPGHPFAKKYIEDVSEWERSEVYERLGFRLAKEIPNIFSKATEERKKILDCLILAIVEELVIHSWTVKTLFNTDFINSIMKKGKDMGENTKLPKIGIEILSSFIAGIEIARLADIYQINDDGIEDILRQTLKDYFVQTDTSRLLRELSE